MISCLTFDIFISFQSCFTIFLPMASSTAAIIGCLLSTYNAAITFGKIITDIFIINAGQAAVYITSAITALLGIVMTGLLWGVVKVSNQCKLLP